MKNITTFNINKLFLLHFPICWFLIYSIRTRLPILPCLKTISSKMPSEATSRIKSDRIVSNTESLYCPVTIYNQFFSFIILIPSLSFMRTDKSRYLFRCIKAEIWMESAMNKDKIISFYDMRKGKYPLFMLVKNLSECSCFFVFDIDPALDLSWDFEKRILHEKVLMISEDTPSIWTISDKLYNFERFWSFINKIPDKIEMISICEMHPLAEKHKLIITTMDISDK